MCKQLIIFSTDIVPPRAYCRVAPCSHAIIIANPRSIPSRINQFPACIPFRYARQPPELAYRQLTSMMSCSTSNFVHQGYELGMLLRKAYLSFHRRANSCLLSDGITADQFVVLSIVANEPGIVQIRIVARTASDPNTVAAILRLLQQRHLVRREAHATDGRARCVFLTAAGARLQRRAAKHLEPVFAALRDVVAEGDRIQSDRFLKSVHERFTAPPIAGLIKRKRRSTSEINCMDDAMVRRIRRRNRHAPRRRLAG